MPSDSCPVVAKRLVAAWRSGNIVGLTNEVTVRRARLVLGWVTVFGGQNMYFTKPPRPTQPPTLSRTGNEYQPKCGDAVRLMSKDRYGSFHLWINVWVAGKTVPYLSASEISHHKVLYKSTDTLLYLDG